MTCKIIVTKEQCTVIILVKRQPCRLPLKAERFIIEIYAIQLNIGITANCFVRVLRKLCRFDYGRCIAGFFDICDINTITEEIRSDCPGQRILRIGNKHGWKFIFLAPSGDACLSRPIFHAT